MKLYVTTPGVSSLEVRAVWSASQGDASKAKTAMVAALKEANVPHKGATYKAVEVPTKKDELLSFLNTYAAGGTDSILAVERLAG